MRSWKFKLSSWELECKSGADLSEQAWVRGSQPIRRLLSSSSGVKGASLQYWQRRELPTNMQNQCSVYNYHPRIQDLLTFKAIDFVPSKWVGSGDGARCCFGNWLRSSLAPGVDNLVKDCERRVLKYPGFPRFIFAVSSTLAGPNLSDACGTLSVTSRFPGLPRHPSSWQTKRSSFRRTRSTTNVRPRAVAVLSATFSGEKAWGLSANGFP